MRTFALFLCAAALVLPSIHAASAPAFNASPSNIYLNAAVAGAAPTPQVIVVNNTVANSTLKWRASISGSGAAYCAVSPSQGTITGQSAVVLSVSATVPPAGGSYLCTVTLGDNGSSPPATNSGAVAVNYGVYAKGSTLPPPNTTPPNVPQYLGAVATGLGTVSFTWFSGGDPAGYSAGYWIYRDNAKIAVTGLTAYQDSGLATDSYHTYTVAAFDSSRNTSAEAPLIAVTTFAAAPSGVPSAYQSLYQGVQSNMATDYTLVSAQSTGVKYPVNYSVCLTSANDNGGRTNFTSLIAVDQELDGVQSMGMNAVMVSLGFPIFDQYFWEFIGQTSTQAAQTVQNYLSFYESVAKDIHGRKDINGNPMRMIIEANPLLTVDNPGGNPDPTGYYQSLSLATYEQRRSANTVTTAKYVQPDYLIVQSEPDTDARDDYRPELNTPATDVAMIQLFANNLNSGNVPGLHTTVKIGSGMGAWQANWQEYLGTPGADTGLLGITGLDGIDNHVYFLTGQASSGMASELDVSTQMIASVNASGKFASIAEFWPHKSLIVGESDLDVDARDNFAFWAALDQKYIPIIFELANQGSLAYLSAFNTGEFYAYEPYAALPCLPVYPGTGSENQTCDLSILDAVSTTVQTALGLGQLSSTGTAYKAEIAQYWVAH
ncbi:MAG TPA: hypothetical protein VN924_29045 [Bryobacteraceae bacterium]|nr:hypothetical protein [Bryobacteraceae bacterium]